MDVVKWLVHCPLSDSPSLTLCHPTAHPLLCCWKKHRAELQRISSSKCPTRGISAWPRPALPGRRDSALPSNKRGNRRWSEACRETRHPKTERFPLFWGLFCFWFFYTHNANKDLIGCVSVSSEGYNLGAPLSFSWGFFFVHVLCFSQDPSESPSFVASIQTVFTHRRGFALSNTRKSLGSVPCVLDFRGDTADHR